MKALFVQRDPFVKMGISALAAVLKENGHSCELLIENLEKDLLAKVKQSAPDLVVFSITTNEYSWMKKLATEIKRACAIPIVCGGPHPTFFPDVINDDYLDFACVGEGEGAMVELAGAIASGSSAAGIKNLIVKENGKIHRNELRPLIEDLDSLPFPDRSIYDRYDFFRSQKNRHVITGRGCPYQCTFCFNKPYNAMYRGKGSVIRRRSPQKVIEELALMKRQDPHINSILFIDDTFVLSKEWVREFVRIYKQKIDLPFRCLARANLIDDDIVKELKNANCFSISIGIESADQHIRNDIYKKGISDQQILDAASTIRKHGVRLLTYNTLGAPGETLESAFETFKLNKKIKPMYAWCSLLQPYPGTDIFEYAVQQGYMDKEYDFAHMEHSYFMDTPIRMEHKLEICNLQKIFAFSVFLRLPEKIVAFLIKGRSYSFYDLIFKISYAIGILKVDRMEIVQMFKTALLSRNYFKKNTYSKKPR
jgi:anaerobic magnesium-protoporphyrin IX monomethyl ester cyclase